MRVLMMLCGALVLAACSDAECGDGERKIGVTCVPLARDSGAQDVATGSDASARDAQADAQVDIPKNNDAAIGMAQGADAAADAAGPAVVAICGDGQLNGAEQCDSQIAAGQPGACPTSVSCKSADACLLSELSGSAVACDARCLTTPLTACKGADGCCPAGCTTANDSDCSASCGNGVVDTGETCESGVGAGCPTACSPADACHPKTLTGSAANCNAACVGSAITSPSGATKDGCCPGATFTNDQDCAGCGDHVLQAPEICDGNCPTACDDGDPCTRDMLTGSSNTCNAVCTFTKVSPSTAAKDGLCCPLGSSFAVDVDCPGCGNGVLESGEICDDGNPAAGDGCNGCQVDDNNKTRGDERAGYIFCTDALTCGPGSFCNVAVFTGQTYACVAGSATRNCDGPEDCPSTSICGGYEDEATTCVVSSQCTEYYGCYGRICHSPADCNPGQRCDSFGKLSMCY